MTLRRAVLLGLALPLSYLVLLGAGLVAGAHGDGKLPKPSKRCFPERLWDDTPGLRPCVTVTKIYEDGSFLVVVSDANGTARYARGVGVPDKYECRTGRVPAAC